MKVIRVKQFGEPDVLQLQEVADLKPGAHDVIVRMKAIGVNPVETYVRSGGYRYLPALPWTPGSDGAGEVMAVGSDVERWKVGDRVYTTGSKSGTYAEQACCHENQLQPLPDNVSYAAGACIGIPYATAYYALFVKAQGKAREQVLVHGASGAVGLAAVQLARAAKIKVVGTASTQDGANIIAAQGANHVFNHHHADYRQEMFATNAGHGFDIILEMRADINLGHDLRLVKMNGRIIIIGSRGEVTVDPRETMIRSSVIYGLMLNNITEEERKSTFAAINEGLANEQLKPVVRETLPMADAAAAHQKMMKPGAAGNFVLVTEENGV